VYAWNTVGSIAGAVGTGYVLLPWIGLEKTLAAGVLLSLALAAAVGLLERPMRRVFVGLAVVGALSVFVLPPARPDRVIRSSPLGGGFTGDFGHLAIGRSSTVALIDVGMSWRLTTNGLPESVITDSAYPATTSAADWLSMLPVLLRPAVDHMVVIGLGGGMTLGSVPPSVDRIEVIELEPEVVKANRIARADDPGDPLEDPRVAVRLSDARGALLLADQRYGAIVSQPSHPWTSGASHLYTREFFSLARSRLRDDGVFVQWIGASFIDSERLRSMVAALNEVFANVTVFRIRGAALVMVSSDAPLDVIDGPATAIAADPDAYRAKGVFGPEDVAVNLVLDAGATRTYSAGALPNTDDYNVLATSGQPASRGRSTWVDTEFDDYDPLPGLRDRLDLALTARALQAAGYAARARALADSLEPARRDLVRGWVAIEAQQPGKARRRLQAALESEPDLVDAAIGLALVDPGYDRSRLPERARIVIEARSQTDDFEASREVEDVLASFSPGELLYPEATEARARWRAAIGDEEEAREAAALISGLIARKSLPRNVLLYGQLMHRLGRIDAAWMALDSLSSVFATRSSPPIARRALALARELGPPPDDRIVPVLQRAAGGRRANTMQKADTGS
jgi:hypothetical protein